MALAAWGYVNTAAIPYHGLNILTTVLTTWQFIMVHQSTESLKRLGAME
jgi:hypothetical protein